MTHRVTYEGGPTQEKRLISHFDYLTIIVPDEYIAATYGGMKHKERKITDGYKAKAKAIKGALKARFTEFWFTDQSPLFDAITTGVIDLSDHMGEQYKYNCKIEEI